tara:strand:- start:43 stop:288 length:246 start_codon:yes stop_codon:yes gene_type:complete
MIDYNPENKTFTYCKDLRDLRRFNQNEDNYGPAQVIYDSTPKSIWDSIEETDHEHAMAYYTFTNHVQAQMFRAYVEIFYND